MAKEVSVSFKLGATLAGSYRTAFQDAAGQARMVSQAIREMGNTPVGQLGAALEKQGARLTGLAGKLEQAEAKLAGLRAQAESAGAVSYTHLDVYKRQEWMRKFGGSDRRASPGADDAGSRSNQ